MSDEPQRRMRAAVEVEHEDLIHNELGSAAYYLTTRIKERLANGDHDGLFLEMIAAVTMTAFSLEAYLNYVGDSAVRKWVERQRTRDKLPAICAALGLSPDMSKRPYLTVEALFDLRDRLAHGKPRRSKKREIVVGTHDELTARARAAMEADWASAITLEFVAEAYDDVEAIWRELLEAAKIDIIETMAGGSSTVEFLGFED